MSAIDKIFAKITEDQTPGQPPVTEKEVTDIIGRANGHTRTSTAAANFWSTMNSAALLVGKGRNNKRWRVVDGSLAIKYNGKTRPLSEIGKSEKHTAISILKLIAHATLVYRRESHAVSFENARIQISSGSTGMDLGYIPRAMDTIQQGIYSLEEQIAAMPTAKLEVVKAEGLLLGGALRQQIRPRKGIPKQRVGISEFLIAQSYASNGITGEAKIGEESIEFQMPPDSMMANVFCSDFDNRIIRMTDAERSGNLALALHEPVKLTTEQWLCYLAKPPPTHHSRWVEANKHRVETAFALMRWVFGRSPDGSVLINLFKADGDVWEDGRYGYRIGRANWLDNVEHYEGEKPKTAMAMRLSGGIGWHLSSELHPLDYRFLSTAERILTCSQPSGVNSKIPSLLHIANRDWVEMDLADFCWMAFIPYDPSIRPVNSNAPRKKILRAIDRLIDYTTNGSAGSDRANVQSTTVEFAKPKGWDGRSGANERVAFRATDAFVAVMNSKRTRHDRLITQIPLGEFMGRLGVDEKKLSTDLSTG